MLAHLDGLREVEYVLFQCFLFLIFVSWLSRHMAHDMKRCYLFLRRVVADCREPLRSSSPEKKGGDALPRD
jgi:hypothetical protein